MNSVKPCVVLFTVQFMCMLVLCFVGERAVFHLVCGARDVACCTLSVVDVRDLKLPLGHGWYPLNGTYSQRNQGFLITQLYVLHKRQRCQMCDERKDTISLVVFALPKERTQILCHITVVPECQFVWHIL
jgi:hypothetical protein